MLTPGPRVILSARIAAGAAGAFSVAINDAATHLREEECFRFALQYYARVLFELVRDQHSVRDLPRIIAALTQYELEAQTNLFELCGVPGSLVRHIDRPIAIVELTMRTAGVRNREIAGDLSPLRGTMLARSVVAVCQAVLPRLSAPMREAVPAALANMNVSYEMTHRYADPESQHEVPALAYLAASFV
ncbi:MAG: hypothetical protein M3Q69_21675, partial [Acidobacteriota bacterium]|nr:hypothetical protein [Acidobacteriota bacterium]